MSTANGMAMPAAGIPEIERPPVGTPCIVCKRLGHWCPAHRYVGSTDDGICDPCAESRNCPQATAWNKKHGADVDVFVPTAPPPTRKIKPLETTAEEKRAAGRCSIFDCGRRAAPNGTFCAERHYAELVEERKRQHWASEKRSDGKPKVPPQPQQVSAAISAGIAKAKQEGVRVGRPPANNVDPLEIARLRGENLTFPEIAARLGLGLSTVKRNAPQKPLPEVTKKEKMEAISILDKPAKARVLEAPQAARASYDAVIADMEEKLTVIQQTIATLKIMRGSD